MKKIGGIWRLYIDEVCSPSCTHPPSRYSEPSSRLYTVEFLQEQRKGTARGRFSRGSLHLFGSGEMCGCPPPSRAGNFCPTGFANLNITSVNSYITGGIREEIGYLARNKAFRSRAITTCWKMVVYGNRFGGKTNGPKAISSQAVCELLFHPCRSLEEILVEQRQTGANE